MYINLNTESRRYATESKDSIEAAIELGDAQIGLESALLYSAKVDMAQKLIDDTKTSVIAAHENKKPLITDVIAYNVNAANEMLGEQVFTMDDVEVGEEGIIGGIGSGIKKFVEVIVKSIKAVIKFIGKMIKGIINFIKSLFGKGSSSSSGGGSSASNALNKIEETENGNEGISEEEAKLEKETLYKEFKDIMRELHGFSIYCISNKYSITIDNVIGYKLELSKIINKNRYIYDRYINLYNKTIDELSKMIMNKGSDKDIKKLIKELDNKLNSIIDDFITIPFNSKTGEDIRFIILGDNKGVFLHSKKYIMDEYKQINERYKDKTINHISELLTYFKKLIIPTNLDSIVSINAIEIKILEQIEDIDLLKIDVDKVKKGLDLLNKYINESDKKILEYEKKMTLINKSIDKYKKIADELSKEIEKESNSKGPDSNTIEDSKSRLGLVRVITNLGSELVRSISIDVMSVKNFKVSGLEDTVGQTTGVSIKLGRNKKGDFIVNKKTIGDLSELNKQTLEHIAEKLKVTHNGGFKKDIEKAIKDKYKNNKELEEALQKAFGDKR